MGHWARQNWLAHSCQAAHWSKASVYEVYFYLSQFFIKITFSGKPNEVCIWGEVQQYPYQTCVNGLKTEEERPNLESIDEIFTPDIRVFVLNRAFYGQIGTVKKGRGWFFQKFQKFFKVPTRPRKKVNEAGSVVLSIENVSDITRFDPSQLERKQTKWLQGSDWESIK